MANDDQPPDNDQTPEEQAPDNGHPNGQTDPQQLTYLVQQFTEAIRELADGRRPPPPAEDEEGRARRQRIQRIDFGYRALGALMGRVSRLDGEFDVPSFTACWDPYEPKIHLFGLPDTVKYVELRAPATADFPSVKETVKVIRYGRGGSNAAHGSRRARVEPQLIAHGREIESMIGLGGLTGPLLAFGPRLPALVFQTAVSAE
jgi:hypothetical protein